MALHFLHRAAVVPKAPPRILPRDTDETLAERAFANAMTKHAWGATRHSYDVVSRQGCYAMRLEAIKRRRAQE